MGDYQKLNQRFLSKGLNVAVDPSNLDYGSYPILDNLITITEGVLETAPGITRLHEDPMMEPSGDLLLETGDSLLLETGDKLLLEDTVVGNTVTAIRRLNRISSSFSWSTYIIKAGTSIFATVDGSNHATTEPPFTCQWIVGGLSDNFGHLLPDRTAKGDEAWMYVSDYQAAYKIGINTDGTIKWENVGITRPVGPPTLMAENVGGGMAGDYNYRYTLYNSGTGNESLFNSTEASPVSVVATDDGVQVTIPMETIDPDDGVDKARIYRIGGSLSLYRFVGEVSYTGAAPVDFHDDQADVDIASATLLNLVSDKPFTSITSGSHINEGSRFGPLFGYTIGLNDRSAPGYIYWTDKFNPEAQDPANAVEVDSPNSYLQSGFVFDNTGYVFTNENLYRLIVGQTENVFVPYRTACGRGLWQYDAFCIGAGYIFFMAKDGVYMTNGGEAICISEDFIRPIFYDQTVGTLAAIDLEHGPQFRMAYYKREVFFQYLEQETGSTAILAYHVDFKRWRQVILQIGTLCMYADEGGTSLPEPETKLLFGTADGYLVSYEGATDEGAPEPEKPFGVRTNRMVMGAPLIHKEYGAIILDIDPASNPVDVTVYSDKETTTVASATYSDATRVRKFLSLNDTFSEDISLNISGTGDVKLYGYELLWRPEVVKLGRWSVTGVNHGIHGWQFVRAAYLTLRSDGTTTFTITIDGTAHTYSVASTSGAKRKIFIPLDPAKGKIFDYKIELGTATYFRLYNDQCEVEVKEWLTKLGYGRTNPFKGGDEVVSDQ